jgi:hypothetical protein
MTTTQKVTLWVVLGLCLAAIVYDVVAVMLWGTGSTISWSVVVLCSRYPIVAFLIGVVVGHILWPQPEVK